MYSNNTKIMKLSVTLEIILHFHLVCLHEVKVLSTSSQFVCPYEVKVPVHLFTLCLDLVLQLYL